MPYPLSFAIMPAKRPSRSPRRDRNADASVPDSEKASGKASQPGNVRRTGDAVGADGPNLVRIIGGKHRGRSLVYDGDSRTRPMKDRVRESLFNLVSTYCAGRVVIDLFAGTGALGLEAISRGASKAIMIEKHLPTSITISKNVETLQEQESCEVCFADTFLWIRRALDAIHPSDAAKDAARPTPKQVTPGQASSIRFLQQDLPWIIFCSPPYEFYISRAEEMKTLIYSLWRAAPPSSVLVIETDQRVTPPEMWPDLLSADDEWDLREYPPARIAISQKG